MTDFPQAERVLVRAPNWLGDLVMSLPALRAVRRAFPRARLGVMALSGLAPLLENTRECDEVLAFERPPRGMLAGWSARGELYRKVAAGGWDIGVLFPNSFSSAWCFKRAGIARRVGYATHWRGWTLTDRVPTAHGPLDRHQAHWYLDIARFVGARDGSPDDCLYEPPAEAVEAARSILAELGLAEGERFVAIAPAAAYGPAKEWPARRFAELAELLSKNSGLRAVLIGAPAEAAKCGEVLRLAQGAGIVSAAGRTGVAALAGLLKLSSGFAGNDSGAMHLAGITGIPAVGIFGSTNPEVTGPLGPRARALRAQVECAPCLGRRCRRGDYACLESITPESVVEALIELMGAPAAAAAPPRACSAEGERK